MGLQGEEVTMGGENCKYHSQEAQIMEYRIK